MVVSPEVAHEMTLSSLRSYCEGWVESKSFAHAVALALEIFPLSKLAAEFDVIPSTVTRWSAGMSTPMLGMQQLVVARLQKMQ